MANQKDANIIFLMLGLGTVGLLAGVLGKRTGAVGDVVASGKQTAGDGNEYDWRIEIMAADTVGNTHVAKAKLPGFGTWDAQSVVAMGSNLNAARDALFEQLATMA